MLACGEAKVRCASIAGELRSVKDGRLRRILPEWVDEYVALRVAESEEDQPRPGATTARGRSTSTATAGPLTCGSRRPRVADSGSPSMGRTARKSIGSGWPFTSG